MTEMLPPHVRAFCEEAKKDYEGFWERAALAANDIHWFMKWDTVFQWDYPAFKWYLSGLTNISYSCLDDKVRSGMGSKAAFIAECGDTGEVRTVTYGQLLSLVKQCAAALRGCGIRKSDRVAIYMPMGIEAAAMMLACARIGAIHIVIFAGFSPRAIADRLDMVGARCVVTKARSTRRGKSVPLKEMMDEALHRLPDERRVETVIVLDGDKGRDIPMKKDRDIGWKEFLDRGKGMNADFVPMESNEPLFLLPTSGTTAKPKITVQNHGGYQVYVDSMARWVYGLQPQDIWFCTSDIGWIVGHSYNVYGPLLRGCTSILYEGTPDFPRPDMWWDIVEKNLVTAMFTSPTGVRSLMKLGIGQAKKHDLNSVRRVFCAGEVLNPAAWDWLQQDVFGGRIPVIDHMWQTETAAAIVGNPYGLGMAPIKPGSAGFPVPGILADVINDIDGHTVAPGEKGVLVIEKPFPGLTPTLWGEPDRYRGDYWEAKTGTRGLYYTGDAAYRNKDGYVSFVGRADEVLKIAAHRIGTIEIENVLVSHPAVVEAAVVGVPDERRGEVASACAVLAGNYQGSPDRLKKELIDYIRREMGPIVVIKDIFFVDMLPKTRSGKIMRRVIKAVLAGEELGDLSTIEEEVSVSEIKEAIQKMACLSR